MVDAPAPTPRHPGEPGDCFLVNVSNEVACECRWMSTGTHGKSDRSNLALSGSSELCPLRFFIFIPMEKSQPKVQQIF